MCLEEEGVDEDCSPAGLRLAKLVHEIVRLALASRLSVTPKLLGPVCSPRILLTGAFSICAG